MTNCTVLGAQSEVCELLCDSTWYSDDHAMDI